MVQNLPIGDLIPVNPCIIGHGCLVADVYTATYSTPNTFGRFLNML